MSWVAQVRGRRCGVCGGGVCGGGGQEVWVAECVEVGRRWGVWRCGWAGVGVEVWVAECGWWAGCGGVGGGGEGVGVGEMVGVGSGVMQCGRGVWGGRVWVWSGWAQMVSVD